MTSVAIIGVSGAGRALAVMMAQVVKAENLFGVIYLIDPAPVSPKDTEKKSYWDEHLGMLKVAAVISEIEAMYGKNTAARFRAIPADVRSVPAILRLVDAVFICVDSRHATAVAAGLAPGWTARVALEMKAGKPFYSVEVASSGPEIVRRYSAEDWKLANVLVSCIGTERENLAAGVAQPLAPVAQAIAVSLFLSHLAGHDRVDGQVPAYRMYRMEGDRLYSVDGGPDKPRAEEAEEELPVTYQAGLRDLLLTTASAMDAPAGELVIEFDTPLETSICEGVRHHYRGFTRYPDRIACHGCGARRVILSRERTLDRRRAEAAAGLSLQGLCCPVGMGFNAFTHDTERRFVLPLDLDAIPPLLESGESKATLPEEPTDREAVK